MPEVPAGEEDTGGRGGLVSSGMQGDFWRVGRRQPARRLSPCRR